MKNQFMKNQFMKIITIVLAITMIQINLDLLVELLFVKK